MEQVPGRRSEFSFSKCLIFSMLPVVLLILTGEGVVRLLGVANPKLHSRPLPEEHFGMIEADRDLMWALKPNQDLTLYVKRTQNKVRITTNSLGLRYQEIGVKQENEYRVLSLGESSTFGLFVDNSQTYSAQLEKLLNQIDTSTRYRVINCGVPAYSSFQSIVYLKKKGIMLKPDMVLFYHEFNDYLPTSLRSSGNTEKGLVLTDKQLYESGSGTIARYIMPYSELFRFFSYRWARFLVSEYKNSDFSDKSKNIGLPRLPALPGILEKTGDGERLFKLEHNNLPRRVSEKERYIILEELRKFCLQHGIKLVIIHPTYLYSQKHECVLTEFCAEMNVNMFEAQEILHLDSTAADGNYIDPVHPSASGHQILAKALAEYLSGIIPQKVQRHD